MHVKLHPLHENDCASCGMRDQSLFANLNSEDFQLINQPIHDLTAEAHTTLFAEGSQGEYVFTVRKGLVKLVRYQSDGSQRIIRLVGPGDIAVYDTSERYELAMTDPFWMILVMESLGPEYTVWDRAAKVEFVRPGRGDVQAEFRVREEDLDEIRKAAAGGEKVLRWFTVNVRAPDDSIVAVVQKQLYVRLKSAGR